MEFLIVSGLSGAGKSTVMSILEDSGFFCVDNLPPVLIPKFAEVCLAGMGSYERVAMVCDIRAGEQFDGLFQAMDTLKAMEFRYKVLFVDADTAAIIQRYKETRRSHPLLAETGSLSKAVERERAAMEPLRARADYIITTTTLPVRKLRGQVLDMFAPHRNTVSEMSISVTSFGFKYGIPLEADLVFDVRFLPNHRAGQGRGGLRVCHPLRPGADGTPAGADGLPPPPLCGGGQERAGDRRGLHRRAAPLGGGDPRAVRVHSGAGLRGR